MKTTTRRDVYVTYARDFRTWNVVDAETNKVVPNGFGQIDYIEQFLVDHKEEYRELDFESIGIVYDD
jgi:hypothetical protein